MTAMFPTELPLVQVCAREVLHTNPEMNRLNRNLDSHASLPELTEEDLLSFRGRTHGPINLSDLIDDNVKIESINCGGHPRGGYHRLYLQENGVELMTPINFEDGMDYQEASLYYAALQSQIEGGVVRALQPYVQRRAVCSEERLKSRASCLRRPKYSTPEPRKPLRRCSFTAIAGEAQASPFILLRSNSVEDLNARKPRVAFQEYTQVFTIYAICDYPHRVRSQIWMSREEMMRSVRNALLADMVEEQERVKQEKLLAQRQQIQKGCVERKPSVDSIITECALALAANKDL